MGWLSEKRLPHKSNRRKRDQVPVSEVLYNCFDLDTIRQ